jgi:hypothetical protein
MAVSKFRCVLRSDWRRAEFAISGVEGAMMRDSWKRIFSLIHISVEKQFQSYHFVQTPLNPDNPEKAMIYAFAILVQLLNGLRHTICIQSHRCRLFGYRLHLIMASNR